MEELDPLLLKELESIKAIGVAIGLKSGRHLLIKKRLLATKLKLESLLEDNKNGKR